MTRPLRTCVSLMALGAALVLGAPALAKEGMWTPDQLPRIAADLKATGLELDPAALTDLTAFPMGAVISLGGCTASFVSPKGLVVTNHHCAYGSIQYVSTPEANYLRDGFLAKDLGGELPAAPGTRVYVTVGQTDVTDRVLAGLETETDGAKMFATIDARRKEIVAECEQQAGHRCLVASFYGGKQYKLVDRLEIRDVRLVYAPAESVGKYGGDIDNWQWPRHTGDFAFYRAYVGPDGQPADYSKDNVPFTPDHVLKVSAGGLKAGDFVMAAGYPGRTSRYERLAEVESTFGWGYPAQRDQLGRWIATIEAAAPEGSEARIKYQNRLASLNNVYKNLDGQMQGARKVGLVERRAEREAALNAWIASQPDGARFAAAIAELDTLTQESATSAREGWEYGAAKRSQLLGAAQRLYRLSLERAKPDAERETGFQERDMNFFRQGLQAIDRRFDPGVEKAEWMLFLKDYVALPKERRNAVFDAAMGLPEVWDEAAVGAILDGFYEQTTLGKVDVRLSRMEAAPEAFETSTDPFIRLAVALHAQEMADEAVSKARAGRFAQLRPAYMEAIIAWQESRGSAAYPDANSTLRVTYGQVMGSSPADGMRYMPFTTLEGITAKDTGVEPFNAPKTQLDAIRARDYGAYALDSLGSVPVNFLSDLDSTGGNSGSPTLNGKGELVGLLFDGTFESVNSDWDFDPRITRTIHVDTRYMLWVMEKVDGAQALMAEMEIVGKPE